MSRLYLPALFILLLLIRSAGSYAEPDATITVAAPYLELRAGPGRGYPVIHTLRRGDRVTIDKRKTGWFYLNSRHKQGWIAGRHISALSQQEKPLLLSGAGSEEFTHRHWELGVMQGAAYSNTSDGTPLIALYGGYLFTANLSAELTLSQVMGNYSESLTGQLNLTHQLWPDWRVSPFISFGIGTIESEPKSTLGNTDTVESDAINWGIGVRYYLKKQFFLRADINQYLLLTQRDEIDKVETWKLGIGVFF